MAYTQPSQADKPELHDIQGLIINGYTHPCSVHMLFKFNKDISNLKYIRTFLRICFHTYRVRKIGVP